MDYAIVKTGGKQYRVSPGDVVDLEKLPVEAGDKIELANVLLITHGGQVTVGSPDVPGAKVLAHVEEQGRGPKIVVFKYKSKTRQGTKTGHRQAFTRVRITDIVRGGVTRRRQQPAKETTEESTHGA